MEGIKKEVKSYAELFSRCCIPGAIIVTSKRTEQ